MSYKEWYRNLPKETQAWIDAQPLWHDRDMITCGIVCFTIGVIAGFLFT